MCDYEEIIVYSFTFSLTERLEIIMENVYANVYNTGNQAFWSPLLRIFS